MNLKEYLMVIVMEECGEIVLDYIEKKEYVFELVDLLAVLEMVESNSILCNIEQVIKIPTEEELIKHVLDLQKLFSKSLRFGFDSTYANISNKELIESITPSIRAYVDTLFKEKQEILRSLIEVKKDKVNKYLKESIKVGTITL